MRYVLLIFLLASFTIDAQRIPVKRAGITYSWINSGGTGVIPPPVYPDYLTNLWGWWAPSQGITADANNTDIDLWQDYVNGVGLNPTLTTEDIPVNNKLTLPIDGQGFNITSNNPGITATDVTFAFVFEAATAHAETNGIWLFDCVSSPRVILKFEISNVNSHLGFQWNGVDKDFGVSYPFGTGKHCIVFRFTGTTGELFIDGVQSGNTITGLTGGQFQMNSNATRRFYRGGSTITRTYKKGIYGHRVYLESVSNSNIALISTPTSGFMQTIWTRNTRWYSGTGQSLESGSGAWGSLPAYLTGNIPRCYLWDNNTRKLLPLSSTNYTLSSPILSFCYYESLRYPNDDIVFAMTAVGGTNMPSWAPPSGAHYLTTVTVLNQLITQLTIQTRNVVAKKGCWYQGQTDAQNAGLSASYGASELSWLQTWQSTFSLSEIVSTYIRTDLPPPATLANINLINNSKTTNATTLGFVNLFTDTFQLSGDNLHHTTQGNIDLGQAQSQNLP